MMFTTLLESRAARTRNTRGTVASVLLHGALITLAVMITMRGPVTADARPTPITPITFVPIPPPERPVVHQASSNQPASAVPQAPAIPLPLVPQVDLAPSRMIIDGPTVPVDRLASSGLGSVPSTYAPGPGLGGTAGDAVDVSYVERAPRIVGDPMAPRYPDALRASGISGHVVARFVVDTLGRAEQEGMTMLDATHPLFADAVRNAIGRYRFAPGEIGGRKVRTMVQLPFTFTVK
ncbi:MAG: energy transducer TonB [bacterium]